MAASYLSRRAHDPSAPVVLTPPRILLAAAGLGVVAVTYGYADVRALQQTPVTRADYLIDQFAELLTLV